MYSDGSDEETSTPVNETVGGEQQQQQEEEVHQRKGKMWKVKKEATCSSSSCANDEETGGATAASAAPTSHLVHNVVAIQHQGDVVQRRAVDNRNAVRGAGKFAHSTGYLSHQLAKGALSENAIKKLDIGLHPVEQHQQPAGGGATTTPSSGGSSSTTKQASPSSSPTTPSPPNVLGSPSLATSALRDSLFRVGESLLSVGKLLEQVEQHGTRLAVAKRRREMLVEMRDKLLRVGSVAAPSSFGSAPPKEAQLASILHEP